MINSDQVQQALDIVFPMVIESDEFDELTPDERDYFLIRLAQRALDYVADKENY